MVDYLTGKRREPRFHAVTVALAAEMLFLGRLAESLAEAEGRIEETIVSGRARRMSSPAWWRLVVQAIFWRSRPDIS